ncbi:MAG: ComEC/Rec2 family competence protein [Candidatus Kerfeldbacteria bacterium]|nr:ComEC/Rec2 family competence protein [Candidatus Kerfeldbacteria bacterium]
MSPARRFLWIELAFLGGVAVARWPLPLLGCFAVLLVILLVFRLRVGIIVALVCLLAGAAGVMRFFQSERWQQADNLTRFAGQRIVITGMVAEEPERRLDETRYVLSVSGLWTEDGNELAVRGRTLATASLYPTVKFGERLKLRCRLARPEPVIGFAYDDYLALGRVYTLCRQPAIMAREPAGPSVRGSLFRLKQRVLAALSARLPEPHAALLGGILVGARSGLPKGVTESFRTAGLSHLVALSGYNITIMVTAVLAATIRAGGSRRHAFWVSTVVLIAFVMMTGASASVVRAAVMGFLAVLARHVGRGQRVWYALAFSATVMVAANPRILQSDVGFHLSFLATLGLVCLSRPIQNRLTVLPERFGVRDSFATTLAATLATLPLIAVQFDRISVIGLLANLLVLPVMPVIMLLGVIVLIPVVAAIALPVLWGLLTWVLLVAESSSAVPWSSLAVPPLPSWAIVVWYGGGFCVFLLWQRLHQQPTVQSTTVRPSVAGDGLV